MSYKWKIWYSNFAVIGSTLDDWKNVPFDDVQAVVEYFGKDRWGRNLQSVRLGNDWYWFHDGKIDDSAETHPNRDEWIVCSAPTGAIIKRGRYTDDDNMDRIYNEVNRVISTGVID